MVSDDVIFNAYNYSLDNVLKIDKLPLPPLLSSNIFESVYAEISFIYLADKNLNNYNTSLSPSYDGFRFNFEIICLWLGNANKNYIFSDSAKNVFN